MSLFYIGDDKPRTDADVLDSFDDALPGVLGNNSQDKVMKAKFDIMRQAAERTTKQGSRGMNMIQSSRPISSRGYRSGSTTTSSSIGSRPVSGQQSINTPSSLSSSLGSTGSGENFGGRALEDEIDDVDEGYKAQPQQQQIRSSSQQGSRPTSAAALERDLRDRGITHTFNPLSEPQMKPPKIQEERPQSASGRTLNEQENEEDFESVAGLNIKDIKSFVSKPPPNRNEWVRCYILRDTSKMNKVFPRYYLYAERGSTFLLSGKKRKANKSSNYCLSLSKEDISRSSDSFIGKLRSNFLGTEFQLFDNGEKASKLKPGAHLRTNLASVVYETNLFGSKGPRKFTLVVPDANEDGEQYQFPDNGTSLISKFKTGDWHHLKVLKNKFPVWNERLKAYVLNFNGRVTMASVKNFQLVEPNNPNKVFLQFGKVDEDRFNIDFKYPLTALQAFSIAISSFDNKIACE
ncbi:tubby protein [Naegleria gruberi]|uniref:Tubby protein n=1 Tax=Naegleria gruberi TaxID=5762 RepID=D2VAC3_NAEGR|nr:tubby protein [Naegleria gruberi]EFC46405.1 tubby protein [Naegleria gruberi]|eukprot:XP_002679149.1 tubby protein [Naegleria gruberi]